LSCFTASCQPTGTRDLRPESSHAVLEYGFARLGLDVIYAGSDPPNVASQNVMQRLGMKFMKRIKINDLDADYFAISRNEFLNARTATALT
jgi:RimJ/RimL family protein N-acetyltransferase